jgi:protein involved in polysaccharide export with SLBB domain
MPSRLITLLAGLACLIAYSPSAEAQFVANPLDVTATGTSYRVFVRPGEPIIRVQVLGDVGSGLYAVGANTTLSELLALAGGAPLSDANVYVARTITVRVFREQGAQRRPIYESTLENLLQEPGQYPTLEDGDLLTVETELRRRFNLRETIQLVSSLASITLLALRLADAF